MAYPPGYHASPSATGGGGRDLILFDVLTALVIVHFFLSTQGTSMATTTTILSIMWLMSLVILAMLRVYGGRGGQVGDIVDYDENVTRAHLPWFIGSVAVIAIISGLAAAASSRGVTISILYVPRPSLVQVPGVLSGTATVLDDVLYNFFLVAQAEESVKLMATLALYRRTGNEFVSAGLPIGAWAVFHAYMAYVGQGMDVFLIAAFLSGIVLYIVLKQTKSLLNAVMAHGLWDTFVILSNLIH